MVVMIVLVTVWLLMQCEKAEILNFHNKKTPQVSRSQLKWSFKVSND